MASIGILKTDIKSLSDIELQDLFNFIGEVMTLNSLSRNLPNDCRESRFSKGEVCPHCKSDSVVKNGKLNGKQRYKCKTCNRTFNDFTKSALSSTKLPLEKWIEYAKCIVMGYSIRKSAKIVEVCVKTSFYMRHKILDAIRMFMGIGNIDGVIEMDETFIAESFKGNHKKSGFLMPRKSRKRGKEVKKRGISSEQVCVATAIDRNGNLVLEMVCKGRVRHSDFERLYNGRIGDDSIICTDSHKSYVQFAKDFNLEHKRIMRGHYKNGIYHINHINSLHSRFKEWMYKFHGVSTKFLANYLYWFKWIQYFNEDKEIVKSKNILIHSTTNFTDTRIKTYKGRNAIFV